MPELPELQAFAERLTRALTGSVVRDARAPGVVIMRTARPPLSDLEGRTVHEVTRRGKLLVVELDGGERSLAIHLMQGGRLGLYPRTARRPLLALTLDDGRELRVREITHERRARAWVLGAEGLDGLPDGPRLGPEPIGLAPDGWRAALADPPGALHAALRDGRRVAGIGRCYASEIMWAARLAPFARTDRMDGEAWERLAAAADRVLGDALERARREPALVMPVRERRVTAVHGHAGQPCLRCGDELARVAFLGYTLVYCPACQTGQRRYSDRRMDRLRT